MTIAQELVAPTVVVIPDQRESADSGDVPAYVLDELKHISDCYRACRERAELLRIRQSAEGPRRSSRDDLVRALERLEYLREQRSALLDAYDLPSSAGAHR